MMGKITWEIRGLGLVRRKGLAGSEGNSGPGLHVLGRLALLPYTLVLLYRTVLPGH